MMVKVEEREAPFTGNQKIEMIIDGEKKIYKVITKLDPHSKHVTYIIPDNFPECMIKVIFGISSKIIGGNRGNKRKRHKELVLSF
ncbi:hypothetical protein [Desulfurobacterium indicum]|uniref:Uncharacterized protein n=1 Tax=Desulfurobacterium indicum TaxID=1914305 RepID=A0A1R1MJE7_9BACT|nr:hypothetical protein [Desulfurobacterium indicum]OMH39927.1 hypothetical protein BLW93_07835 [Desulfurobacterium indicum]